MALTSVRIVCGHLTLIASGTSLISNNDRRRRYYYYYHHVICLASDIKPVEPILKNFKLLLYKNNY